MKNYILILFSCLLGLSQAQARKSENDRWVCIIEYGVDKLVVQNKLTKEKKIVATKPNPVDSKILDDVVYIACKTGNVLMAIDLVNGTQVCVSCPAPECVCVAKNMIYVPEGKSKKIKVYNPKTLHVSKVINVIHEPTLVLSSQQGDYVSVLYRDDDQIGLISTSNNTHLKYFKTGKCPCSMIFTDKSLVCASLKSRDIISIDLEKQKIVNVAATLGRPRSVYHKDNLIYVFTIEPDMIEVFIAADLKPYTQVMNKKGINKLCIQDEGCYSTGELVLPFYPTKLKRGVLEEFKLHHNLFKDEPLTVDSQDTGFVPADFKTSNLYKGLKDNPSYLKLIAFDSFTAEQVLRLLESCDDKETQEILIYECMRCIQVALWLSKKVPAVKLYRWVAQLNPLEERYLASSMSSTTTSSSSSSTSSSSTASTSSSCTASTSSSSTASTADTKNFSKESALMIPVTPHLDEARFPVAGIEYKGYSIISNHNAGTVSLIHNGSKTAIDLKVGNFPTFILPLVVGPRDSFVCIAVLGDKSLQEKSSLVVIDLDKKEAVEEIVLPEDFKPDQLKLTASKLIVTDLKVKKLVCFDLDTLRPSNIRKIIGEDAQGIEFYCGNCSKVHDEKFAVILTEDDYLKRLKSFLSAGYDCDSIHHFYLMYLDDIGLTQEELLAHGVKPL